VAKKNADRGSTQRQNEKRRRKLTEASSMTIQRDALVTVASRRNSSNTLLNARRKRITKTSWTKPLKV
jgi:hypothetical protein